MPFIGSRDGRLYASDNPLLYRAGEAAFEQFVTETAPVGAGPEYTTWTLLPAEHQEIWMRIAAVAIDAYDKAESDG